jgi:hypothetical protein
MKSKRNIKRWWGIRHVRWLLSEHRAASRFWEKVPRAQGGVDRFFATWNVARQACIDEHQEVLDAIWRGEA